MELLLLVVCSLAAILVSRLWSTLVWRPWSIQKLFRDQGIKGPEYRFFIGTLDEIKHMREAADSIILDVHSHDIASRVLPHMSKWMETYGKTFLVWLGPKARIVTADYLVAKQVLSERTGLYPKPKPFGGLAALLGKGLVFINDDEWARHRRVVNPAFSMDKLKMMTKTMADCAHRMIQDWEMQALQAQGQEFKIELAGQFEELTSDVISHTAFGSNYEKGRELFAILREMQELAVATFFTVDLPLFSSLPTKQNRHKWELQRKERKIMKNIIQERLDSRESDYGNDLLGLMLEACMSDHEGSKEDMKMSMDEIMAECKTFFFAGQDTTSHLLTWAMFLLSTNQEWQKKIREEVLTVCGKEVPTGEMLNKLKLVPMVLYETLRLYSPVVTISRTVGKDTELGGVRVPEGTGVSIPIAILHRDKEVWGADADEFNPLRFENGVNRAAKLPNALLAFSAGPRSCIGQNFAMIEAKLMLSLILQRFSFTLSSDYKHAPKSIITLLPKYGLPIILKHHILQNNPFQFQHEKKGKKILGL